MLGGHPITLADYQPEMNYVGSSKSQIGRDLNLIILTPEALGESLEMTIHRGESEKQDKDRVSFVERSSPS